MHSIFPSFRVSSNAFFALGGQSIGASASASVLPINIQDWFLLGLTGLTSLKSNRLLSIFFNTTVQTINSSVLSSLYSPTLTSIHEYCKKTALTRWTFVGKVVFLIFNMLSMLVIAFLPRSKCILISWFLSPSAVILEPKKRLFPLFPHLFAKKWWDQMPWSSFPECWVLSQLFTLLFLLRHEAL